MALAFAALLAVVVSTGGAGLEAPANPTAAYDARPLWYFRWLFLLRKLMGPWETVAALIIPGLVLGFLVAMPLLDRTPAQGHGSPRRRRLVLATFFALCAGITALTAASLARDAGDARRSTASKWPRPRRRRRERAAWPGPTGCRQRVGWRCTRPSPCGAGARCGRRSARTATRARTARGRSSKPATAAEPGIARFFADPGGDEFYGRNKVAKSEGAMKPVELAGEPLAEMVELVYAESGAADADRGRAQKALPAFEEQCSDCHSREEGVSSSGPALARRGSLDHLVQFIGNPTAPIHLGEAAEMPRFDKDLSMVDREALAQYLLWLRTATAADVAGLEPL